MCSLYLNHSYICNLSWLDYSRIRYKKLYISHIFHYCFINKRLDAMVLQRQDQNRNHTFKSEWRFYDLKAPNSSYWDYFSSLEYCICNCVYCWMDIMLFSNITQK